jgi:hypothetical protein
VAIDLLEFEVRAEDEWPEFSVNISLTSVLEERKNRCFVTNSEVNPGESDPAFASKTSLDIEVNVTWGLGLEVYDCAIPWTDSFKGRESRAALWQRYISLSNLRLVYGC